jgi:hypothetical protein
MVKAFSPMMSLDASGTVGKSITFSKWKGRNYVRKRVKPANPKSGLQTGMRAPMRFMSQSYASLTTTQKTNWKNQYKSLKITGLNSQARFNQTRVRQNLGLYSDPTNTPAAAEAAPTGVTATAQPKSVKLVWVDSAGANDYATFIHRSTQTGFTPDVSNLVRVVKHGVQTFTDSRLPTGTAQFYVLRGTANEGTIGTAAAQVTATPT